MVCLVWVAYYNVISIDYLCSQWVCVLSEFNSASDIYTPRTISSSRHASMVPSNRSPMAQVGWHFPRSTGWQCSLHQPRSLCPESLPTREPTDDICNWWVAYVKTTEPWREKLPRATSEHGARYGREMTTARSQCHKRHIVEHRARAHRR